LSLEVDVGWRVLRVVVVEKRGAAEKYEHALESGDAAVMLEAIEPGLYTMNVGIIVFRFFPRRVACRYPLGPPIPSTRLTACAPSSSPRTLTFAVSLPSRA
jgi:hypothetical protein